MVGICNACYLTLGSILYFLGVLELSEIKQNKERYPGLISSLAEDVYVSLHDCNV